MLVIIGDIPTSTKILRDCRLILYRWCRAGEVTSRNRVKLAESERRKKHRLGWMGLGDQERYRSQLSEDLEPEPGGLKIKGEQERRKVQDSYP